MNEAHVRVLGAVQFVAADGEVIDLPSATQRRLLAILALAAGTTLRPAHLADAIGTSSGALRTALSRLRARVGEETIRTDAVGYRITCPVDSAVATALIAGASDDGDRLGVLDEALSYWHGPALDEFRHESWAAAEVTRLDELRAIATEDRAEVLIARGRAADAVVVLEAHVHREPLRDRPRGLLLQALAAEGRQADALRAYQDYRTYLLEEIGIEPSEAVRSIEQQVAAGWRGPTDDVPFELPLHPVLARGPELIGRRRELAWLDSALAESRAGTATAVLVSGEPGIGKTTLLASFARSHHRPGGAAVVYGRCAEGAEVPLQPFRSIVGAVVDHAPERLLLDHVEHCGGDLQRLAPNLAARVSAPSPTAGDDATERYQLFEAVADVLRRVAGSAPLVLVLDDLHWGEPTAFLLLRHLSRSLADVPVLLAVSWRDTGDEASDPLRSALADLDRAGARRMRLTGFDDVELSDLVESLTTDGALGPDVVGELRAETAGNPLYAVHLVRHLVESGLAAADDVVPPSLRDVLWSRVRALGSGPADVLGVAAVLGPEFPESLLVEVADTAEPRVEAAMDAAVDAGLLEGGRGRFRFTHGLVAHALATELGGEPRRRLHERAARVLERDVDPTALPEVVVLARHWEEAGQASAALQWSTTAGDVALGGLAAAEAASWYQRALDHSRALGRPEAEQADLLVRLGTAQHRAGDPAAHGTILEAGGLAERTGADDVLVRAALANEHTLVRVAPDEEMLGLVEAALGVADRDDAASYATLLAIYAVQLINSPRAELRQSVAREAIELVEQQADATVLPRMISALQFALWGPGALPLRRQLADRAATAAEAVGDPFLQFWTGRAALYVALESADPTASASALDRVQALAAEVGEPTLLWVAGHAEVFDLTMRARFEEAEQLLDRLLEQGTRIGEPDAFSLYAAQLFVVRSFAGRYEELLPLLEELTAANPGVLAFRLAHAIGCSVTGRPEVAEQVLAAGAASGFAHVPADLFWMTTVIGYAVLAIELRDVDRARELFPILEPYGEEVAFNGATSQGHIGAYLGKLASLFGDHDLADEHLTRSLEVNVAFGWEYHEATTSVALALSRVRRTGALDEAAAAWLDRAEAIAAERGLALVTADVAQLRAGDVPL